MLTVRNSADLAGGQSSEDEDDDRSRHLRLDESGFLTANENVSEYSLRGSSQMFNVPSYRSFLTEFHPPDLNQFSTPAIGGKYYDSSPFYMTSAWRVLSFFFVIFVLPTILISVPLYARYKLYSAKTLLFTNGDMHSLHQDVSSFWCQGQRVISNGSFEAYLTPQPRRLKRHKRNMHLSSEVLLMQDDVEQWGFYFIRGTRFKFQTCSRWAGATLLVVKGEENLRRCFYREERFIEEMKDTPKRQEPTTHVLRVGKKPSDSEGGEVLDSDDVLDLEAIRQLRSSKREKRELEEKMVKKRFKKIKENLKVSSIENEEINLNLVTTTEKSIILAPEIAEDTEDHESKGPDFSNMIEMPVHKGTFFYNMNDTLDVKSGNSSYSSSEEFMAQCRDTIVSIELTPYIDCNAEINSNLKENRWNFAINESDFYYFIFFSDNDIETNVLSFHLQMNRSLYDVSKKSYTQKCFNSSECVFPFSFMKSAGVIVDYGANTSVSKLEDLQTYELTAICQPRSVVYTVFILFVPFIIFLFAFR